MSEKKILMLVGNSQSSYIFYNSLKQDINITNVILEEPKSIKTFVKRRIKSLGLLTVIGQTLFKFLIIPLLKRESKSRVQEIMRTYGLSTDSFEKNILINTTSVNSDHCIETLKHINPDIVIVNGTRIISKKVLNCINATFINTHAGITPLYRGIHGAYWSKINKDGLCGVSVHLVDPGIDTGGILYQEVIETNEKDNFISYTFLQMAKGIELMKHAIKDIELNQLKVITNNLDSKFRTHPTIWFYLKHRIFHGVK